MRSPHIHQFFDRIAELANLSEAEQIQYKPNLKYLNQCAADRRYDFDLECEDFYETVETTYKLLLCLVEFDIQQDAKS